ncbi:MAG: hypothetical protein JRH01_13895 [Deltaproteobacteria bacterium]|nr:hypothetical protein [Deltaproteobacteria bacterium]MBW2397416.1 hypothetical protein [Deltaproteobacteria bacterium]
MALGSIIGFGLFCAASLWVGLRLLSLWWRTREMPELLAGLALLLIGPLGFGCVVLSDVLNPHSEWAADVTWAFAAACVNLGSAACYAFSRRVFRPDDSTVRWLVATVFFALAACWCVELWTHHFDSSEPSGPATRLADWLRCGALGWAAFESLLYAQKLKQRARIGLAEPGLRRRFILWGVAMGASAFTSMIDATTKLFVTRALDFPALTLLNACVGMLAAACLFLAFYPSRSTSSSAARV